MPLALLVGLRWALLLLCRTAVVVVIVLHLRAAAIHLAVMSEPAAMLATARTPSVSEAMPRMMSEAWG